MEVSKLKKLIEDCFTTIYFKYAGEWGNVEPCYNEKTGYSYSCYYGDVDIILSDIDDVMNLKFVCGKSLNEISNDLEDVDW
ncbi:MAG: hypothetical protein IKK14_09570 [Oscillospiraceae bacterium]|nr:hypothetical protein [Oscillospiraceae bacterium]